MSSKTYVFQCFSVFFKLFPFFSWRVPCSASGIPGARIRLWKKLENLKKYWKNIENKSVWKHEWKQDNKTQGNTILVSIHVFKPLCFSIYFPFFSFSPWWDLWPQASQERGSAYEVVRESAPSLILLIKLVIVIIIIK